MNFKNIIVLLIFSLLCLSKTNGQKLLVVKKNNFVDKSEASVLAYEKIKEAIRLYEQDPNNTTPCLPLFLEAYKHKNTNAALNFNIAVCYLNSDSKDKAAKYLQEAYEINPTVGRDISYQIGRSLQYDNDFLKAIKMFQQNIELLVNEREDKNKDLIESCEKHIAECRNGLALQATPTTNRINALDYKVNSKFNDLNPIEKGNTFFFSSEREANAKGEFLEKVYSITTDKNGNTAMKKEDIPFRTYTNVALISFQGDNEYIFYSGINGGGDFIPAQYKNEKWIANGSLPTINSASSREASACIAGNELYFVSDRQGSLGECDIYYCKKEANGSWSKPNNLGAVINTEYDEADVFVTPDGKELYFNSKGHNTMGGFDIFKSLRLPDGSWSIPVNMGIPVNSPYNEIQYFKSENGAEYFSSDRNGGSGGFDIYAIGKIAEPKLSENEIQEPKAFVPETKEPVTNKVVSEVVPELIYRVQILACKNEASVNELYKIYNGKEVIEQQFIESWYKYAIGKFKTYSEAEAFKNSCGIQGAFIVLFKNGQALKVKR